MPIRTAFLLLLLLTLLTGLVYPLATTAIAQILFPSQANGSLIVDNGVVSGSRLIGQPFNDPRHFWPRPSATTPFPYNSAASTGSNLGPLNSSLKKAIEERRAALRAADPGNQLEIPVDLVTASASGLDPHLSPEGARYQVKRVARARGLDSAVVSRLAAECTEPRAWGFLGEPAVNVLILNRALDRIEKSGTPARAR